MALELQELHEIDADEDQDDGGDDWYAAAAGEVQDYHTAIAAVCWPHGARLMCRVCGHEQLVSPKQLARFLATSLPTCHGKTMQLADVEGESHAAHA